MTRAGEILVVGLAAGLCLLGAAAYWPLPDGALPQQSATAPAGADVSRAEDWIAQLGSHIEVLERRPRDNPDRPSGLDGYRLLGLVELDGESWAMLSGEGGIRSVQAGDRLDGYEVVQIRSDRIVFTRNGEDAVLWLEP